MCEKRPVFKNIQVLPGVAKGGPGVAAATQKMAWL